MSRPFYVMLVHQYMKVEIYISNVNKIVLVICQLLISATIYQAIEVLPYVERFETSFLWGWDVKKKV